MATEDLEPERSTSSSAFAYILGATIVAGGVGYVIQAVVPAFTDTGEYVAFSVFWSVVYLVVSAVSGVQQEITRASRVGAGSTGWSSLRRFAVLCAGIVAIILMASSPFWAPRVFVSEVIQLIAALTVAAVGYTFVAALSGALYGVRHWRGAAAMTVLDAVLRLVTVGAALALGAGMVGLGWAVALPFLLAAAAVWLATRRGIRHVLVLDTDLLGLARNSLRTVAAAIATGLMISGLPFLLGVTSDHSAPVVLASLILVITLTRAPLVIPLLALQSLMVVTFRDATAHLGRRVGALIGGLLVVTGILSGAAVVAGPWLIGMLYGDRYELPPVTYAAIVASAGLTGVMCLTGPAVLASGRHTAYLVGWVSASLATVGCLLLPVGEVDRVIAGLLVGPVVGAVVHGVGLATRRPLSG